MVRQRQVYALCCLAFVSAHHDENSLALSTFGMLEYVNWQVLIYILVLWNIMVHTNTYIVRVPDGRLWQVIRRFACIRREASLRSIARLGQPFGRFILLAQQRVREYKTIASGYEIIVRVKDVTFADTWTSEPYRYDNRFMLLHETSRFSSIIAHKYCVWWFAVNSPLVHLNRVCWRGLVIKFIVYHISSTKFLFRMVVLWSIICMHVASDRILCWYSCRG